MGLLNNLPINHPPGPAIDTSVPQDPYAGQRPQGGGGLLGKMGIHNVGDGLGFLADALMFGPATGVIRSARKRTQQNETINNAYKQAMAQKAMRENNTDTPAMREADAMGMPRESKEWGNYVTRARNSPRFMMMGSPETGQSIVDPEGGAAPQVGTVQDGFVYTGGDPSQPTSWRQQ